jgi:hypothetical protein
MVSVVNMNDVLELRRALATTDRCLADCAEVVRLTAAA